MLADSRIRETHREDGCMAAPLQIPRSIHLPSGTTWTFRPTGRAENSEECIVCRRPIVGDEARYVEVTVSNPRPVFAESFAAPPLHMVHEVRAHSITAHGARLIEPIRHRSSQK